MDRKSETGMGDDGVSTVILPSAKRRDPALVIYDIIGAEENKLRTI